MKTNNELLIKGLPFFEELFGKGKVDPDNQQMMYLDFLTYDNEKLNKLDEEDEMKFGIVRFVKNNHFSKTSRYYTLYKKKALPLLDEFKEEIIEEDDRY